MITYPNKFGIRNRQAGSALLVTLLVVSLLMVLVLSFTLFVRMELRRVGERQSRVVAMANARLGLELAVARLQETAGPDQRVTGRADLLDGDVTTPEAVGVDQPFWTGTWKTFNPDPGANNELDVGTLPTLRSWSTVDEGPVWLVSTPTDPDDYDPVVLARQIGAVGSGGAGSDVTVPLVEITDPDDTSEVKGKYAYWVEDEGIKAKINLAPNDASFFAGGGTPEDKALNARHYLSPATAATDLAFSPAYREDVRNNSAYLQRLVSMPSLGIVLGAGFQQAEDGFARSHPDTTIWSQGVLADVRKGGLRTDLTAAFENVEQFVTLASRPPPGRDETYSGPDDAVGGKLWRAPGVSPVNTVYRDGTRIHTLYSFYNRYKKAHPNYFPNPGGGTYPWWVKRPEGLGGIGGMSADMSLPVLNVPGQTRAVKAGRLLPALLGIRLPIYVSTYANGANEMGVRLHYSPNLVLYNPWNIQLEPSPDPNAGNRARFFFTSNILTASRVRITNQTTGEELYHGRAQPETGNSQLSPANTDLSFSPGQVKMFGSDRVTEGTANYSKYDDPTEYPLVENFDGSFNYWNVPLDGVMSDTDLIEITFETRIDTSSGSDANSVRWLFDNSTQGELIRNPLSANQEYSVISGQPAASFEKGLDETPLPLAVLLMRTKGLFPDTLPHVPAQGGPGALWNPFYLTKNSYFWEVEVLFGPSYSNEMEFQTDGTNSFWGASDVGRAGGETHIILKEVFQQPLLSVGQFKNADTVWINSLVPVGNSWADPELANQTSGDPSRLWFQHSAAGERLITVDDSFLNNEALFDRFFFSTIPPATLAPDTAYPPEWTGFSQAEIESGERLLNPRLVYYRREGQSPPLDELRDMDTAAAHLWVDGAFNVNSTSIPVWRALLGSLRYTTSPTDAVPVPRFITDLDSAPTSDDLDIGMRVLDDTQLDRLAEEMVEQVKSRGPFLSMADFVNRRRTDDELGKSGALQAAIDNSGINTSELMSTLGKDTDLAGPKAGDTNDILLPDTSGGGIMKFMNGITPDVPDHTSAGMPGVITQADFLQALAPILTARSDTFRIRVYGETAGGTPGERQASAIGEAVVQRLPEFLDQSDPALTSGNNLGNATPLDTLNGLNTRFGRRFQIVSFRWLQDDI